VSLNVSGVEDERLLGRLYHTDMAELVDEETTPGQLRVYSKRTVLLPELLQIRRIDGIWSDRVFLAPKHNVVFGV
jgi:hypothetical protein